ncbi:MAG: DNA/RNA nuclease SfsA [Pseudomonadaceae bacterium]|nr:DNA/RNA nuclease SfsA [Pseudomonadaceae bacterium]
MQYESPLIPATHVSREKRFFIHTDIGTAHCPNTGSMKSILDVPIARVWLADHGEDSTRKLRYGAEVMELESGERVSIHTGRTNKLAEEALLDGTIAELAAYQDIRREARWDAATRFDFQLNGDGLPPCWVEVKSVTLKTDDGAAAFPDAVSTRGQKHLQTLMEAVAQGQRAVQLYIVAREGCSHFRPADEIDPTYAALLREAKAAGVDVLCYGTSFTTDTNGAPTAISVGKRMEIML